MKKAEMFEDMFHRIANKLNVDTSIILEYLSAAIDKELGDGYCKAHPGMSVSVSHVFAAFVCMLGKTLHAEVNELQTTYLKDNTEDDAPPQIH